MILETIRIDELDRLINDYQIQLRVEGKSAKTISIYTTALKILWKYLNDKGLSTNINEISAHEIKQFIFHLKQVSAFSDHPFTKVQQRGLAPHTINCYLRALRAFWGWLVYDEVIEVSPFDKIKIQKPPKRIIPTFSNDQLKGMLAAINKNTPIGFRDYVIIIMLLDTGLRISELVRLTLHDINLDERSIKVFGKGSKERIVPIGRIVQRTLVKYIRKYRVSSNSLASNHLFVNANGCFLKANVVENVIVKYGAAAGIVGVRCSPHTFRHTFAINYLRNGGDVFTLQQILGHETLDMVRNYVNVAQCDVQTAHLRYSPVDNVLSEN